MRVAPAHNNNIAKSGRVVTIPSEEVKQQIRAHAKNKVEFPQVWKRL